MAVAGPHFLGHLPAQRYGKSRVIPGSMTAPRSALTSSAECSGRSIRTVSQNSVAVSAALVAMRFGHRRVASEVYEQEGVGSLDHWLGRRLGVPS